MSVDVGVHRLAGALLQVAVAALPLVQVLVHMALVAKVRSRLVGGLVDGEAGEMDFATADCSQLARQKGR